MDKKKLGIVLKDLRIAAGVSQREAADQVGATDKAVSSYETGRVEPPFSVLIELLRAYNVSLSDLEPLLEDSEDGDAKTFAEIGACLAALRSRAGLSKEELANALGWSLNQIKKAESRRHNLKMHELGDILHQLNYNLWDLAQAHKFVTERPLQNVEPFIEEETARALESGSVRQALLQMTEGIDLESELRELRREVAKLQQAQNTDEPGDNGNDK